LLSLIKLTSTDIVSHRNSSNSLSSYYLRWQAIVISNNAMAM